MDCQILLFSPTATVQALFPVRRIDAPGTSVILFCTMRDYIRPDQSFRWFREGELISTELDEKYNLVYIDSSQPAQNGEDTLSPARLSLLSISNPQVEDTGFYTCGITGTTVNAQVQLIVDFGKPGVLV